MEGRLHSPKWLPKRHVQYIIYVYCNSSARPNLALKLQYPPMYIGLGKSLAIDE